jgi:HSP20 family protein
LDELQGELQGRVLDMLTPHAPTAQWAPINLWSNDQEALLLMELPGVNPADIHVSVKQDLVTVEANLAPEPLPEGARLIRRERPAVHVRREVRIPFEVDPDQVDAQSTNGLLRVHLRRHAATLPTRIEVKGIQ